MGGTLLLTGCDRSADVEDRSAAARTDAAAAPSAPASLDRSLQQPASTSATLTPVDIGDRAISWPRVSSLLPAAVDRINAVLDRRREAAVNGRNECREIAQGRELRYSSRADVRYNRNGLLSFRITGEAFCGGANGTTIADALTFDLATGREIKIAELIGLNRPQIAEAGRPYYSGSADCAAFLRDQRALAGLEALFIDSQGLGVIYAFNAGAAESCANRDAIIPIDVVGRTMRLGGPLSRAWINDPPAANRAEAWHLVVKSAQRRPGLRSALRPPAGGSHTARRQARRCGGRSRWKARPFGKRPDLRRWPLRRRHLSQRVDDDRGHPVAISRRRRHQRPNAQQAGRRYDYPRQYESKITSSLDLYSAVKANHVRPVVAALPKASGAYPCYAMTLKGCDLYSPYLQRFVRP